MPATALERPSGPLVAGTALSPVEPWEEAALGTAPPFLIRLRWLALVAFLALPLGAATGAPTGARTILLVAGIVAMGVTNVLLHRVSARAPALRREAVGAVLVLDVALLTGLLFLTGGASNPGTVVYLVHITFAAMLLGKRWAWGLTGLSIASFGLLFVSSGTPVQEHVHDMAADTFSTHIAGMWVAFAATAALLAYVVSHVASALAARESELAEARSTAARNERLAALTTLAAGATHELATPLSTIAVTASEMRRLAVAPACRRAHACSADADLIVKEVQRCHRVLDTLSGRAHGRSGGERPLDLCRAMDEARRSLSPSDAGRVDIEAPSIDPIPVLPHDEMASVLGGLVRNALDASPAPGRVTLSADVDANGLCIRVRDRGTGMPPEVLARVGEPFFTTKPPGHGLGLGVFLARTTTEQLGGRFAIESSPSTGTTVTLRFPTPTSPGGANAR
jgi:two-component system sensor histidine kinase RegB